MPTEKLIFAAMTWLVAMILGVIAIWAFKRKDPMHFWSGTTVKPEEITDISAYNRANGWMWTIYATCMFLVGVISLFSIMAGAVLLGILCVPGIGALILIYNKIYRKYKNPSFILDISENDAAKAKTSKGVVAAISVISAFVLILIYILTVYGEKDPEIKILDDSIQIKAYYGLSINFSDISDIHLIEQSMREIGPGVRTNGYDGFGKALKGNFKSDSLGDILLFVQENSSPTIMIDRKNNKDIYISFKNSNKTEGLYFELKQKLSHVE